jgi:KaiC/GvpD/RAD55 family RecA-like ATPase
MDRGALVLGRSILKGAMAERLQTGIPGFDELLGGGLPKGSAILIQMPMGAEKDLIMMQLAKAGMISGQGVLVTLSDSSPEQFYGKFEKVSVRPEVYADKGGLRIVDWNTYKTKRVRDVEEDGAVIRSSKGITNLGIAITDAGQTLQEEEVKRAVIDVVSSAVKIFGMDTGYRFVQTIVAKLKEMGFTTIFIVDKDMHEDEELGTISQTFDGVIDIERTREGKRIVTEIMVLSMSKPGYSSDVKIIEITDRGLVVVDE